MSSAPETVQRRAAKNAFVGAVAFIANTGIGLIAVPICLRGWGQERYGAWLAVLAGYLLLRTLDAGYIAYVGNELNLRFHHDQARMRRSLASALPVCAALGAAEIIAWQALDRSGELARFLGVSGADMSRHELSGALGMLLVAGILTGSYIGVIHRFLIPLGLMYQANWILIGFQVGQSLVLIGAVLSGASVFQAVAMYAGLIAINHVSSALFVRHKAPEYFPWWKGASLRSGLRDFGRSLALTLNGIGLSSTTSGLALFVSSTFGAGTLPLLASVRMLASVWITLAAIFTAPLLPEIVRYHAVGDGDKLSQAFRAHWFFSGALVNLAMGLFVPLADLVYSTWTRDVLRLDHGLLLCLLAGAASANAASAFATYLAGINRLREQLALTCCRAVVLFALAAATSASLGLRGVGAAVMASELVGAVLSLWLVLRELRPLQTSLPRRALFGCVLSLLPIHTLALAQLTFGRVDSSLMLMAAGSLVLVAWFNWRSLDPDIRVRALQGLRFRTRGRA